MIAQRCRGTQASGNLLESFKFLKLGKKIWFRGSFFLLFYSLRIVSLWVSIFDTFVLHLLLNQIFCTLFPTICF